MLRPGLALSVCLVLLAGCAANSGGEPGPASTAGDFSDLDVDATETTGVLLGVVVDETIRPIAGASVVLQGGPAGDKKATTDQEGRFAFDDLEPGTYFLQ